MDLNKKYHYCAYYCEENIWKLCADLFKKPQFQDRPAYVVFISNPHKSCAIWHQKAAESADKAVVFDYHVILLVKHNTEEENQGVDEKQKPGWQVWDLDTTLGIPVDAETYIRESFSIGYIVPEEFQPLFRVLTARDYLDNLSTDRSHMRDKNGKWLKPPPEWEAPFQPERGMNLYEFVEMEESLTGGGISSKDSYGEVLNLRALWERFF